VREALFSILGSVEGNSVLDLYAGAGTLGIEALSRGASRCVFVDDNRGAVRLIHDNLATVGASGSVFQSDVIGFLERCARSGERFDLVFADPPYAVAPAVAGALCEKLPSIVREKAPIVFESDKHLQLKLDLPVYLERTYGDTRIEICRVG
jgi:16S rRNA (guanine966-N2)-methyltransferase